MTIEQWTALGVLCLLIPLAFMALGAMLYCLRQLSYLTRNKRYPSQLMLDRYPNQRKEVI